jgi:hypothetical protein
MEYLPQMDDHCTPVTTPSKQHPLRQTTTPLSTPERPLLTDFGGSMQHIYMEVDSQLGTMNNSRFQQQQQLHPPPPPPPAFNQYQPIQIPILLERVVAAAAGATAAAGSSNSSQSSGYYSEYHARNRSGATTVPASSFGHGTTISSRGFKPKNFVFSSAPGGASPVSRMNNAVGGGLINAGCTVQQQLEIQDSQII